MPTIPNGFTHLEVHSHYTLLGGTASIDELVSRASDQNMPALALTDTHALYGAVEFRNACARKGIKPIVGMAVHIKVPETALAPVADISGRLVLLAEGKEGYETLCGLSSLLQGGDLAVPVLNWEILRDRCKGLICLTGGRAGWIERLIKNDQPQAAARFLTALAGVFGDQCYLSICPNRENDPVTAEVAALGRRFGVLLVAVRPIFSLDPNDIWRLRLLAAIKNNCRIDELDAETSHQGQIPVTPHHWPDSEEIAEQYRAWPEALARAAEIAGRCQDGLPDGRPIWPAISLESDQTAPQKLAELAKKGFMIRYAEDPAARERLQRELEAIVHYGYEPLFLIVADIVRYARSRNIPINTRGSVANSLVSYCLGITHVDPVAHDLLFERFLNPDRATLPDIDLDLSSSRRDEVLEYTRHTYGAGRMALVGSMSTLQPRSALRETVKAFGLGERLLQRLLKLAPRHWHPDPRRRRRWRPDKGLDEFETELERDMFLAAVGITGQPHHLSIHPGGVVLTPGQLSDIVPVQMTPKGFLATQYGHQDLETLGLPKIDLLGIRALTVVAETAELIDGFNDGKMLPTELPEEDEKTGKLLSAGETIGVFQCESTGAQRTLRQLKARNVHDLAIANAFFKPGPATGGMASTFVRRYRGDEDAAYLHPTLEPILESTKGVLIFQEQVLRIAREIAGLSWAQADILRKGMSKFQAEEMETLKAAFISGCRRPAPEGPQFSAEQAQILWNQVFAFAGYGFNKGHATAYADLTYRSAYLKAHFPAEFLCARLRSLGGFHHPAVYIAEARRLGYSVQPPHINFSESRFTLTRENDKYTFWMGLGQVRDLRRAMIEALIDERANGSYESLRDLWRRVPLSTKEIRNLIRCGAFDQLDGSRSGLLDEVNEIDRAGNLHQLSFTFTDNLDVAPETKGERMRWEMEILGMPVKHHPLETLSPDEAAMPLREVPIAKSSSLIVFGLRLPGWTGGKGFFLEDGDTFIRVIPAQGLPGERLGKPWQLLRLKGSWRQDQWGGGWLYAGMSDVIHWR